MYALTKRNVNETGSMSDYPLIVYINNKQYSKYLASKTYFYLIFELSKKNRKCLMKVIQDCLENSFFSGIVFLIDKNEILFDRLFFLRDVVLKLFQNSKKAGIWGIPYCVEQQVLGSYFFSQSSSKLISQEGATYCKYIPPYQSNSSLLLSCFECIDVDRCDGLGSLLDNHFMWRYRTSQQYRKIGRDKLFRTDNEEMQKMYNSFCEYVDNSDLRYADRYLYFVKNIDFGSLYSFSDRFVYHCDYLPFDEYEKELGFLNVYIQNKGFLSMIRKLAEQNKISKIAYSKARSEEILRESFYVAPNDEKNYDLLDYFNIDLKIEFSDRLYGVGVDFYNGQIKSYKVYFMAPLEILLQRYPYFFKKIGIDLFNLHEKYHYYIIRLDEDKNTISERIDLVYNDKDHSAYQLYFAQLPFSDKQLKDIHIYTFAFEFEKMDINKMNIYYRNRFTHAGQIGI